VLEHRRKILRAVLDLQVLEVRSIDRRLVFVLDEPVLYYLKVLLVELSVQNEVLFSL
jgi:hypothetical protein